MNRLNHYKLRLLCYLDFANNTILSCFLIPAAIAQIFNPIVELVIPIGISSKEAKTGIQIHRVIVEAKIRKCSIWFGVVRTFLCFLHFALFLQANNFLFYLFFLI